MKLVHDAEDNRPAWELTSEEISFAVLLYVNQEKGIRGDVLVKFVFLDNDVIARVSNGDPPEGVDAQEVEI